MTYAGSDFLRAVVLSAAACGVGLVVNASSPRPVPILDPQGPGAAPQKSPRLAPADLKLRWSEGRAWVLLDVRQSKALSEGRPSRSFHLPADRFGDQWPDAGMASILRAAEGIVVMCEGGRCSTGDRIAKLLRDLGYFHVHVLEGGWPGYQAAGLETASP